MLSYDLELPEHNFRNIFQKALDFWKQNVLLYGSMYQRNVKSTASQNEVRKCCLDAVKRKRVIIDCSMWLFKFPVRPKND